MYQLFRLPMLEGLQMDFTKIFPNIGPNDILTLIGQVVTWGTSLILLWVAYRYIKKNVNSLLSKGRVK